MYFCRHSEYVVCLFVLVRFVFDATVIIIAFSLSILIFPSFLHNTHTHTRFNCLCTSVSTVNIKGIFVVCRFIVVFCLCVCISKVCYATVILMPLLLYTTHTHDRSNCL